MKHQITPCGTRGRLLFAFVGTSPVYLNTPAVLCNDAVRAHTNHGGGLLQHNDSRRTAGGLLESYVHTDVFAVL